MPSNPVKGKLNRVAGYSGYNATSADIDIIVNLNTQAGHKTVISSLHFGYATLARDFTTIDGVANQELLALGSMFIVLNMGPAEYTAAIVSPPPINGDFEIVYHHGIFGWGHHDVIFQPGRELVVPSGVKAMAILSSPDPNNTYTSLSASLLVVGKEVRDGEDYAGVVNL